LEQSLLALHQQWTAKNQTGNDYWSPKRPDGQYALGVEMHASTSGDRELETASYYDMGSRVPA
jgi:L,D-peptidoglycan transpeptidase YkuD (ErfK/YbiS/YcfS/YnhG family)